MITYKAVAFGKQQLQSFQTRSRQDSATRLMHQYHFISTVHILSAVKCLYTCADVDYH